MLDDGVDAYRRLVMDDLGAVAVALSYSGGSRSHRWRLVKVRDGLCVGRWWSME